MHRSHCPLIPGIALVLVASLVFDVEAAAGSDRPDIVLIVAEDMGCDLGCYGNRFLQTPHIDRLAAEGLLFENAYTTQASCSPSRSSMLTGLYPHENGQIGLKRRSVGTSSYTMHRNIPNLATLLKESGYHTAVMGKVDVDPEESFAFDQHWPRMDTNPHYYEAAVRRFLADRPSRPFFLLIGLKDAHKVPVKGSPGRSAYVYPEEYEGRRLGRDSIRLPPWYGGLASDNLWEEAIGYYEAVLRVDHAVGLIDRQIEAHGSRKNTCILFTTDHGPPILRAKTTIYESGVKIPLIARWPGYADDGRRLKELVSIVDLFPTIIEMAGGTIPAPISGRSLLPVFKQQRVAWRQTLCCEWNADLVQNYLPQRSIRDARYKLIENALPGRRKNVIHNVHSLLAGSDAHGLDVGAAKHYSMLLSPPALELYDLEQDPNEWENLAEDPRYEKTKNDLMRELRQWQRDSRDFLLCDEEKSKTLAKLHREALETGGRVDMSQFQEDWAEVRKTYRKP